MLSKDSLDLKTIAKSPLERLHLSYCKMALGIHTRASNVAVWGDCGRLPLTLSLGNGALKYYNRIKEMENRDSHENSTPLVVYALKEQELLGMDWVTQVLAMSRLDKEDTFTTSWNRDRSTNRKMEFYNVVKTSFYREEYLDLERDLSKWIARLRCSAHRFNIEVGRHQKYRESTRIEDTLVKKRACPNCTTDDPLTFLLISQLPFHETTTEDEEHVLLHCPGYDVIRNKHLSTDRPQLHAVRMRNLFKDHSWETAVFLRKANNIRHPTAPGNIVQTGT